ncbi:glutathione S-transferase family protein [Zhongshania sp.]|jgi:glutathione S-transferase|uniref:glutathione S-transferase family protein n=1 Tax=Zhongshania sp. TaxID=1971902 RepID=UPI001B5A0675|nr:glutathione S-transferase family protein [Zhongshania sp.]MBQ0797253.1 glutathione S-transferase family protein [Zhongshania sp.]
MITLYGFNEAFGLVDASPFVLKVDVYLRMAGLEFERKSAISNLQNAPKGKLPYIVDGDKTIADSAFILDYLNAKADVTMSSALSPEQRAQAYLIAKSLDENLYWCLLYSRWVCEDTWPQTKAAFFGSLPFPLNHGAAWWVRKNVRSTIYKQGMGRHSKDEVKQIFVYTMDSLSILLGTKPYFMNDKPSFLDACAFAFLAEFVLATIDNEFNTIAKRYENLTSYCQQIHARYYV